MWNTIKQTNTVGIPEEERKKGTERIFEGIIAKTSQTDEKLELINSKI